MEDSLYRFPENKQAENSCLLDQLCKLHEEALEAKLAYLTNEGSARIIEELWDAIQAAEGALRKFPLQDVKESRAFVLDKCQQRGDYEGSENE